MNDDEIRRSEQERKRIEEERIEREYRKIVKEYEAKRRKEVPLRVRISERVRGGQERFVAGARKAGGAAREGVRRAAAYEPSEGTKKAFSEAGHTVRSEFQEASNYYAGGGSRKGKGGRQRSRDVFDVNDFSRLGIFEPEPTGTLETASFAKYADNFDPFKRAAKQKDDSDSIFQNPYAQYVANFDVLNQSTTPQKGKRQQSDDIISRWFS